MSDQIAFASVDALHALIRSGEVSVVEVIDVCLARIDRLNPTYNAVVALRAEAAMREARAADCVATGERGPLHGVPFAVKDVTPTLDLPTTWGSRAFAGHRTGYETLVVGRLRGAGAILVGKTNTPEFASEPVTRGELFGETCNPWDPARTPGGSSGGAAAGLAAGMVTLAQGTDAGGSIRIPASCCGVVGIKPTRGLVGFAPGPPQPWGGLLHNGPMARSVRDTATMLDVMATGRQGRLRAACERALPPLRLAYATTVSDCELDDDVELAFIDALQILRGLGLRMVRAHPDVSSLLAHFPTIAEAAFAEIAAPLDERQFALLETTSRQLVERGRLVDLAGHRAAIYAMQRESARVLRFFERHDVLVTPTVPWAPPLHRQLPANEEYGAKWAQYALWETFTAPWNMTGQPAISIPCRLQSRDGLPMGLQLIGRPGSEAELLTLASAFEMAAECPDRRPPLRPDAPVRSVAT
ncbi:MAG: amidase [Solirubrobacteraceae bacterium]